ncbi:hypothetical protein [Paracerasibacillus soli]|uniref:Small acid-soluble spore protein P n=1 Tax=Paracerasibacillus soli TaxID=480284 RepID=A0ABU5CTE2_9BACI|nr:hypothetical protein [Virgibacillus soli]MDY0409633.1 hypothetical protein [Virgibacillus soli]
MGDHGSEKNNQFKENKNSGEHRNGRKSQFKNHNSQGDEEPNEYISRKRKVSERV